MTCQEYKKIDIVEVFIDVQNELGYPPSPIEISGRVGIPWQSVKDHLCRAEERGEMRRIEKLNGKPASHRAWRLEKPAPPWEFD